MQATAATTTVDLKAVARSSVISRARVAAAVAVSQTNVAIRLAAVSTNADPSLAVRGTTIRGRSACLPNDFASSRRIWDLGASPGGASMRATVGVGSTRHSDVKALLS